MQSSEARRKVIISIALRRQKPGSGSSIEILRGRTYIMRFPNLQDILAGLPWCIVGAAATRMYMPERFTADLDIAILPENAQEVANRLTQAGFRRKQDLTIGGSCWESPDGFPVDLIEVRENWWPRALVEASNNLDAQGLPIAPLPYLVLMKFQSGRVQDLADVSRMLGIASSEQLEAVRAVFAEHEPEGADDLESLIILGKLETPS